MEIELPEQSERATLPAVATTVRLTLCQDIHLRIRLLRADRAKHQPHKQVSAQVTFHRDSRDSLEDVTMRAATVHWSDKGME